MHLAPRRRPEGRRVPWEVRVRTRQGSPAVGVECFALKGLDDGMALPLLFPRTLPMATKESRREPSETPTGRLYFTRF